MGPSGLLPVGAVQLLFFTNLQIRSVAAKLKTFQCMESFGSESAQLLPQSHRIMPFSLP